jgi:23S rRNA pseudouridine1911/1915/1917 synthase
MSDLIHQMIVAPLEEGRVRLDVYLSRELSGISRSKVQLMIDQGLVKVNGQTVTTKYQVKEGDQISYGELVPETSSLEPVPMRLEILFEDDQVLVLSKPAGLAVHPGAGESGATLVHGLLHHSKMLGRGVSEDDGEDQLELLRPGIVHRLDKDTTGVIVVAKTDGAHAHLSKQFHDKTNFRQYVALLNGAFPDGDWVRDSYLYRDPRDRTRFASMDVGQYEHKKEREGDVDLKGYRFARTVFKRESQYRGVLSLVSLKLYTGRTHQIRIHARDLGCSVVGDQAYGRPLSFLGRGIFDPKVEDRLKSIHRQMLHAWILGFHHPTSNQWMQFEAPLPPDFAELVAILEAYRD